MAVYAVGDVAVYNSGDITAEFDGDYGTATGVQVASIGGDVYFYNSGSITASNTYGDAAGVALLSKYYTELVNEGTITGDVAVLTGASYDEIWNYGTINGSIQTGSTTTICTTTKTASGTRRVPRTSVTATTRS